MTKRKILHITQATGGVKTYVAHVLDYINPDAFEFAVIAPADVYFEKYCSDRGIPYYRVNLERGINPFKNAGILSQIVKVIKKEKPDVIHAHSAKGGFLGRLAAKTTGTKVVYTPHAFSYLSFAGAHRMAFYWLEYVARRWTTLLLAISYSEANRAIHELGYDKNKVKVILNSIPVENLPMLNRHNEGKKIRMIGRLTHQKNHLMFLEVANRLLKKYPDLEFSILGAGIHDHLTDEINDYLSQHQLTEKVKIERWGDVHTSKKFLEETDIFVMTSVFEGLPFSLLEAMLLGIPCVVTKVDGNTDVVQNSENGYSCLSVEDFCDKLELLITDQQLRCRIGKAGHDYVVAKHNIRTNIKLLEEVYLNI